MKKVLLWLGAITWPALGFPQMPVADPSVPVPSVLYRSVFADTPTGVETQTVDWKRANAEVGQFSKGHADILKWEANQAGQKTEAPMPAHTPASGSVKP